MRPRARLRGYDRMATFLVTGGAGFIGSHIATALVERGHRVRVLDDLSTGKWENVAHLDGVIEWIEGDVRDLDLVRRSVHGAEVVFHQAALPSVPRSVQDPVTTNEVNVRGTLNVLVAAREAGVRRVVYASSSSVYGDNPDLPKREDMPTLPRSPYAVSKLAGENYCKAFWSIYGFETVALRYFNVFGPRQDPESQYAAVIPKFIRQILGGDAVTVQGDGLQSRDFTYIENVIEANILAAVASEAPGQAFNVACGERWSILDVVDALERACGRTARREFVPPRAGDVRHSLADISAAEKVLGYHPNVGFMKGVLQTVAWYRQVQSRPIDGAAVAADQGGEGQL